MQKINGLKYKNIKASLNYGRNNTWLMTRYHIGKNLLGMVRISKDYQHFERLRAEENRKANIRRLAYREFQEGIPKRGPIKPSVRDKLKEKLRPYGKVSLRVLRSIKRAKALTILTKETSLLFSVVLQHVQNRYNAARGTERVGWWGDARRVRKTVARKK